LLWVDIPTGLIHEYDPSFGKDHVIDIGQPVGAVALRQGGGLVVACRDGFAFLEKSARLKFIAKVEADDPSRRMNDGACDPLGRFWAGTMAWDKTPGAGSLYRLDGDGHVQRMLTGLTISNGIDWSPDGRTMYFIDSALGYVDAFDFNPETGVPSNRRHLVKVPPEDGMPDGMAVDAQGFLWVAIFRGGRVCRYSPDGSLQPEHVVQLPVTLVTSCAFGDPDLGTLYITSAWRGLDDAARSTQTHAGALFRLRPGVMGREPNRFAG
jgi:sugar lactone lactonase YvrE